MEEIEPITPSTSVVELADARISAMVPSSVAACGPAAQFAWDEFFQGVSRRLSRASDRRMRTSHFEQGIRPKGPPKNNLGVWL
jgi:hypothetical protein